MRACLPISISKVAISGCLLSAMLSSAATLSIQSAGSGEMGLNLSPDPLSYFYLQQSTDLTNFTPFSMVIGDQATVWPVSVEDLPTRFFRYRRISLFAPEDTDGDGIDDVYEIRHPILNPLDPNDAGYDSGHNGLTFLQEYRAIFSFGSGPPEVFSREVSTFNFGEDLDVTVSREVSLFNFGATLDSAISRELSVFNFGTLPYSVDISSREVSVYNGEGSAGSEIAEVFSREVSIFNFGAPLVTVEAISREISVFNGESTPSPEFAEAHSREVTLFNFGQPSARVEAISREVSVVNNAQ